MPHSPLKFPALIAAAALSITGAPPLVFAQAPAPAAPVVPVAPSVLIQLFNEADKAFTEKQYDVAVAKIQEFLQKLGPGKEAPYELLYFNIGLANLLGGKYPEAEESFKDYLKRYPKGEFASRSFLGVGRACMMQDTPEKKQEAINALKSAALDLRYRSEAGLWLGQVYIDLNKNDEALAVFRSLMGSDVRTPQQTTAAVEVIGLLADNGNLADLTAYLDRLSNQAGVRDTLAWYANQMIVRGDELVGSEAYEAALQIYRSIPPRNQIIQIQSASIASMQRDARILQTRVDGEKNKPINQRSSASDLLNALKPAIELTETALKAIEEKPDLDAALLMRRGRCLFYLNRFEEARLCFRTIRTKYPDATDGKNAAYAEIVILNQLKDIPALKELVFAYMTKYKDAENLEQVAGLAGEVLVQSGDWKAVKAFYDKLIKDYPKSENIDRYTFFLGVATFQEADFKQALSLFDKFLKAYPNSQMVETAMYYSAMANFLGNDYKGSLAACSAYLKKFPDGRYAGDMHYRLAFIYSNDKEEDQTDKIIRELGGFLAQNPDDLANGSMLSLLADTYKKKDDLDKALECYKKAVWTDSPDDVIQYAIDAATSIMQGNKDWEGIAKLHSEFMTKKPDSQLALLSASWVAKMMTRMNKNEEAAKIFADNLKLRIGDPSAEQVEFLIDEFVKSLVPRKKPKDIDADALDKQLVEMLEKSVGKINPTANARIFYARARLAQMLKRNDRSDLYLKGIATTNAKDPSVLSPALLSVCGDILLKTGDLNGAEAMFRRLKDRYAESIFADAGPVGEGYVALARKKPEDALKIFNDALETNPGSSKIKEATFGKLQALFETGKTEDAMKLALESVGDRTFKGEWTAKIYLILGQCYEKNAAAKSGSEAKELLKQAHGTYQRVYVAYQGYPELCAEAYWRAYLVAKELGESLISQETLKTLAEHPKLQNTEYCKKAKEILK